MPENVPDIVYVLVTNRYATYYELSHRYTIDEAIDLYEICLVNLYNQAFVKETLQNTK